MPDKRLPKEYKGYSTEQLLEMIEMRLTSQPLEGFSDGQIAAMNQLAREYRLTPQHQQ